MAWWQRQYEGTTRGRLVSLLRRGQHSVEELAAALRLTDNAVRAHLSALERDRIVRVAGIRRDGAVGKPATEYGVVPESEPLFSAAYAPLLRALLTELAERMPPRQLAATLRAAGRRLSPINAASATFAHRVHASARLLADLGADAELLEVGAGYEIRSHGCPLSDAVIACPAACIAMEALLSEMTGAAVREHCERKDRPQCRFFIPSAA